MSQNNQNPPSTWDRIVGIFRRRENNGTSRGEFCSIWPDENDPDSFVIWNDRPLFVWQGTVKRIEVRPFASETVLWSYEVTGNEQSVPYSGPALQPGEEYDYWVMYEITHDGETKTNTNTIPFEIMEPQERERIAAELEELENSIQTQNPEEIAVLRAEYFEQEGLWADVIQEVFALANLSEDWEEELNNLRDTMCQTSPQ